MLKNLGLKIEVFLFAALIFVASAVAYYLFSEKFIVAMDVQTGTNNLMKTVASEIQNEQFKLIKNSSDIRYQIEKSKTSPEKVSVKSSYLYAVLNNSGDVISGTFLNMNSMHGVSSVERAFAKGIASDGYFSLDKSEPYIVGVLPFNYKNKIYAVVSFKTVGNIFSSFDASMPIKVFYKGKEVVTLGSNVWEEMLSDKSAPKIRKALDDLSVERDSAATVQIDKWTKLTSIHFQGKDVTGGKITVVGIMSFILGHKIQNNLKLYLSIGAGIAIFLCFIFVIVVTVEIDRLFKKIATDIGSLKVGEKLVLNNYGMGSGIVVSAINLMISKYQRHGETNPGININELIENSMVTNNPLLQREESVPEEKSLSEMFANTKSEMVLEPVAALSNILTDDESDPEKTQIAQMPLSMSSSNKSKNPYSQLWEKYRKIKIVHGIPVKDREEAEFIDKLDRNSAAIKRKFNCRTVVFEIEDKGGRPVIKAKPKS